MQLGSYYAGEIDTKGCLNYNTNMTTITISNPSVASQAGEWCAENLLDEQWSLGLDHVFTKHPQYNFGFKNQQHAIEFALRWFH